MGSGAKRAHRMRRRCRMSLRRSSIWVAGLVVALGTGVAAAPVADTTENKILTPEQLKWHKAPPGLPPTMEVAVLEGNPMQPGWFVARLRMPDGSQIRPHWHTQSEHITILSGHFLVGMGDVWSTEHTTDLPPGGYVSLPSGHRHFALARGESIVQVSGPGPFDIHYVHPEDDPRSQQQQPH